MSQRRTHREGYLEELIQLREVIRVLGDGMPPGWRVPPPPKWGHCGECGTPVPCTGKVIGFFGATDEFPVLCREHTAALELPELVKEWDLRVERERQRQAQRGSG